MQDITAFSTHFNTIHTFSSLPLSMQWYAVVVMLLASKCTSVEVKDCTKATSIFKGKFVVNTSGHLLGTRELLSPTFLLRHFFKFYAIKPRRLGNDLVKMELQARRIVKLS